MSLDRFPVGAELTVTYPNFEVHLHLLSAGQMAFEIKEGPYAHAETVDIHVVPLGNAMFAVSWREKDGSAVTNVQDYDRNVIYSHAALPNGQFLRMSGTAVITRAATQGSDHHPQRNKALVTEAMVALFQQHDASAVDRLYAEDYLQHNPDIPQGRDALRALVADLPKNVFYEPGLIVAERDVVAIHGRIRGWADVPQVVVDVFRIRDGKLAEHWDVLQNEVPLAATRGAVSMFDPGEAAALND